MVTNPNVYVEVLRTNVRTLQAAGQIIKYLTSLNEGAQVTIDLQDVDRVLRIAASYPVDARNIIVVINSFGFQADLLPDTIESAPANLKSRNLKSKIL